MRIIFILCLSLISLPLFGQMSDSFDDGDFTNNPTWTGDVDDFKINDDLQLQLDATVAGESYLSTEHNLTSLEDKEWRYKIKYAFAPSNNNRGNTYLTATSADLSSNPDGIYFRIGENGANDPIELIERSGGVETTILTSTPAMVAASFDIHVKIIYRANGDWELYVDTDGEDTFLLDETANHPTTITGTHLGVQLIYTVTNATRFYYDDFYAGEIFVDNEPPNLDGATPLAANQLEVAFDEMIDQASGEDVNNYSVSDGIGNPTQAEINPNNAAHVILTFGDNFSVGHNYTLSVENVEDLAGNAMSLQSTDFIFMESETPEFGDIIINEFMVRATPSNGLPETQFVELYNRSDKYFNLNGWKLSDNSSSGTIQDVWMQPGDYLVLVPTGGLDGYPLATNVTSWAQLNLTGDDIHLATDNGIVVDYLTYTDAWYQDDTKKTGGWTIERINPELLCSSVSNWKASVADLGGTPGEINSVYDNTPDTEAPTIINVFADMPNQLTITFSELMDSQSLANIDFFTSANLTIDEIILVGNFPDKMTIVFNETFEAGVIYEFSIENFSDCSGNNNNYEGFFIIPQEPEKGDLIINEILFNPLTGGSDFVEIYNNSNKFINLKDWEFANIKDGEIGNNKVVSVNYILAPNDYVVATKDINFQMMNYPVAVPNKFIEMDLPSYTNDSSTVFLIYNNTVMDKVSYNKDWHFALLQSQKGVSLERISPDMPSNSSDSWHSASETIGFATPGRVNSQEAKPKGEGTLTLSSKTISPDEDGFEDVLLLTYQVDSPDLLGSITIYDDRGRVVKTLVISHLLGSEGTFKWAGTTDDDQKANIGPHVIIFDIFDLNNAKQQTIRKVVTVAGRL